MGESLHLAFVLHDGDELGGARNRNRSKASTWVRPLEPRGRWASPRSAPTTPDGKAEPAWAPPGLSRWEGPSTQAARRPARMQDAGPARLLCPILCVPCFPRGRRAGTRAREAEGRDAFGGSGPPSCPPPPCPWLSGPSQGRWGRLCGSDGIFLGRMGAHYLFSPHTVLVACRVPHCPLGCSGSVRPPAHEP